MYIILDIVLDKLFLLSYLLKKTLLSSFLIDTLAFIPKESKLFSYVTKPLEENLTNGHITLHLIYSLKLKIIIRI